MNETGVQPNTLISFLVLVVSLNTTIESKSSLLAFAGVVICVIA
jgi:hypothetical protein